MQASKDVTNGASPLAGAETEGEIVEHPGPAEAQLDLNTSEQIKSLVPLARPEQTPGADNAQAPRDTTTGGTPAPAASEAPISLWEEAYNKLCEDDPKLIEAFEEALLSSQSTGANSGHATTPRGPHADKRDLLQALANRQLDELSRERYRLSVGDENIVVRDQFKKILQVVLTFKDLISSTIAAEPISAMAWSGVAFALQVCCFHFF